MKNEKRGKKEKNRSQGSTLKRSFRTTDPFNRFEKIRLIFVILLLIMVAGEAQGQRRFGGEKQKRNPGTPRNEVMRGDRRESGLEGAERERMVVMFWNVENLFDCTDNPEKEDGEFLPESPRHWTFYRYRQKLIQLSKVIIAVGQGEIPALVGMCEVENDTVMEDLLRLTPLGRLGYRYFVTASPDERGINIALLYKRDRFRPVSRSDIRVEMPRGRRPTRDILHITGIIPSLDTLDLFICHFPSRSGGELESRPARNAAKRRLRGCIDSLWVERPGASVLVMGDLNDYPETLDLTGILSLSPLSENNPGEVSIAEGKQRLYALMSQIKGFERGTHKYDGAWGFLDHFIVGASLLDRTTSPYLEGWEEYRAPFLLTDDPKYLGKRPKRTYYGYRYEGGFSDHLPIRATLWHSIKKAPYSAAE